MIGALSLSVDLAAIALVAAWIVAWPLLGIWGLVAAGPRWRLARFNVLLLAAPLLVGVVAALGAVWPGEGLPWGSWDCHCATTSGPIHLCLAHPAASLPLLPLSAFLLVWLGRRPARVARAVARNLSRARALERKDARAEEGVFVTELGAPNAVTVGLFKPSILADRRWWNSLTPEARQIVAEHERAHVACRDPLSHTAARLLAGLVPARIGRSLVASWLCWAERRADEHAARAAGDPALVAELLLQQARVDSDIALVPSFRGGALEARIAALLAAPRRPTRLTSDVSYGVPLYATLAVLLIGLCGYQIHVLVERLLRLFP